MGEILIAILLKMISTEKIYIRIKIRTYRKSETHSFVEYTWKYDSDTVENNYEVTLEEFAKEVRELAEEINCAMRENLHI